MIVRIGSQRPAKVDGTRDALELVARVDARFAGCVLDAQDLTAMAPRQPMSLTQILDGARSRARALIQPRPSPPTPIESDCDAFTLAIGLEGGLHEVAPAQWVLASWAAVTDGVRWGFGAGPSLELPGWIAERVLAGDELGDVIDALAARSVRGTRGAWGVLTRDLITRRDAFRMAVLAALAPFYNGAAWDRVGTDVVDLDSRSD